MEKTTNKVVRYRLTIIGLAYVLLVGILVGPILPRTLQSMIGTTGVPAILYFPILLIIMLLFRGDHWALQCADIMCPPTLLGWLAASILVIVFAYIINYFSERKRRKTTPEERQ